MNKARSISGEAKPLLERKSSEFCASTSGGSPPGLETGPRSENTGKNIPSDLGDGSGSCEVVGSSYYTTVEENGTSAYVAAPAASRVLP